MRIMKIISHGCDIQIFTIINENHLKTINLCISVGFILLFTK